MLTQFGDPSPSLALPLSFAQCDVVAHFRHDAAVLRDCPVKRKPRASRERTQRRVDERAARALADDRERLFQLEPGGSPERPIDVSSASVVEAHALSVRCPRCDGPHELREHLATTVSGVRLREVRLACRQCGSPRRLYFKLRDDRPN